MCVCVLTARKVGGQAGTPFINLSKIHVKPQPGTSTQRQQYRSWLRRVTTHTNNLKEFKTSWLDLFYKREMNSFYWTSSRFKEGPTRSRIQGLGKLRPRKVLSNTLCRAAQRPRGQDKQRPAPGARIPRAVHPLAALMRLPALKVKKEGKSMCHLRRTGGALCRCAR